MLLLDNYRRYLSDLVKKSQGLNTSLVIISESVVSLLQGLAVIIKNPLKIVKRNTGSGCTVR